MARIPLPLHFFVLRAFYVVYSGYTTTLATLIYVQALALSLVSYFLHVNACRVLVFRSMSSQPTIPMDMKQCLGLSIHCPLDTTLSHPCLHTNCIGILDDCISVNSPSTFNIRWAFLRYILIIHHINSC